MGNLSCSVTPCIITSYHIIKDNIVFVTALFVKLKGELTILIIIFYFIIEIFTKSVLLNFEKFILNTLNKESYHIILEDNRYLI